MKKIFTLIAVVAMALSVNAQLITWTAPIAKKSVAGTYSNGAFSLTVTDTTDDGKIAVDANNAYFGDATTQTKFTHRLKTGGKSDSKNNLSLTIPAAGTLKVYVRTGSNSATDRNLVLTQGETELYNKVVVESDAIKVKGLDSENPDNETKVYPIISVKVESGTVAVTYPTNSLNFYGFEFVADGNGDTDGITAVKSVADVNAPAYNLAGQKVADGFKGLVIKNGKKFVNK